MYITWNKFSVTHIDLNVKQNLSFLSSECCQTYELLFPDLAKHFFSLFKFIIEKQFLENK